MSVNVRSDCICTCPVSCRLVSSCPVFSCLVVFLRDSGRMFRVSLLRCLVCLARSLFVFFGLSAQCHICLEDHFSREGRERVCVYFLSSCVVCCVLFYNPCACTLFVFGSGWSTVARLKLEGIDGKSPSGAEPAACEPAACERPVVVCVGGEGGGEGERVSASIASPCVRSKRPRVYRHQAHIFHTCGLGAGTHADVLNVHTEAF